jgi:toxin HigB-1
MAVPASASPPDRRRRSIEITVSVIICHVIRSFRDRGTEDIFDGADTRSARRACPRTLWRVARRKLDQINRVQELRELAVPPGNRLESLGGERRGQYSIRINDQYRICFSWEAGHADEVEITDYH